MKDKKRIQKVALVIILVGLIVAAFVTSLFIGSGVDKYSGVKRAAAQAASEHARQFNSGIDGINHLGTLAFRIESVEVNDFNRLLYVTWNLPPAKTQTLPIDTL